MSDPVSEFVARINDRSQWVVREGVPLFEPHVRYGTGPDGKPVKIVVTANDLPEIAAEIKRLEDERGFYGKITLGSHLFKVLPTGERVRVEPPPPLGGFFRNARVGTYGPKNLPAVLVDNYYLPEHAAEADKYPNRSADYYHGLKRITGMALLTVDPALPMGTVYYHEGHACYQYAMGEGSVDKPTDDPKPGDKDKPGDDGKAAPAFKPEEEELFEKCRQYMCQKYGLGDDWPTAPKQDEPKPADDPAAKTDPEKPKEEVTPMSQAITPEQYEQEMTAMRARVAGIELERDQERCLTMVSTGLVGYALSDDERTKEVKKLVAMPAADRPERVKELKAIYADRKVPHGRLELHAGHVEGGKADADPHKEPWYQAAATAYMLDHPGTSYDAACEWAKAQQQK